MHMMLKIQDAQDAKELTFKKKIGACSYQEIKDELRTKDAKDSRY
jgi:hypothetical protein